jgi:tetratricopeptide (TPR) repeat protein
MNSAQWARVTALFDEAIERPPLDREVWLSAACHDEDTRVEVVAMLRAYDADPAFMEQAPDLPNLLNLSGAVAHAVSTGMTGLIGRRLGAYRLVAEIGRGGMGVVYEVQRDDREFDRRAAIKILQASSGASLAERFRFERRVLAGLDHPGIARLIDAGTTPDGLPYFVMEYVDGQRIDDWCRARGLRLRERVALVERVCEALAYAHQHLVIHRDVKPANILVTDEGLPKLLDFGIATVLMGEGESSAGMTRTGQHSFTPEYASPEQIRGDRVTTASDVYSVGVVLYQLLAERAPYAIKGMSPLDAMRTVCDVDPPLMSAAATHDERALLRGDLDSIVAKALAKAPGERYGTIAALTADLRAWREGRPVTASPQSVAYRARRFVRRNRGTVAAITAIIAAIVIGAAATAWQAHVAARERDKAQNRFRQVQEFSRSLLFDVHDALRPVPGATEPRRLLLSRAVQLLDGLAADAGDDDALKFELAEGYRRLGAVQGDVATENLGDTAAAVVSFEKAARLVEDVMRADPRALEPPQRALTIYSQLTNALNSHDRPDAAEQAQKRLVALVEELERRRVSDPRATIKIGNGYSDAGIYRAGRGDLAGARAYYERAISVYESVAKDDPAWRATPRAYTLTLKRLGAVEMMTGALEASERHYLEALAIEEDLIRRQPDNAQWQFEMSYTLSDLGVARIRRGDVDGAMTVWLRSLALRRTAVAADSKNVRAIHALATILNRVGRWYRERKRYPEALATMRDELRWRDTVIAIQGPSPGRLLEQGFARLNLAGVLLDIAGVEKAADARTPAARAHAAEARTLFESIRLDELKSPGSATIDADFRKLYDIQAARFARR